VHPETWELEAKWGREVVLETRGLPARKESGDLRVLWDLEDRLARQEKGEMLECLAVRAAQDRMEMRVFTVLWEAEAYRELQVRRG